MKVFFTSLLQAGWCGQQEHSPAGLTPLKLLSNMQGSWF